jgi:hypothetical protein
MSTNPDVRQEDLTASSPEPTPSAEATIHDQPAQTLDTHAQQEPNEGEKNQYVRSQLGGSRQIIGDETNTEVFGGSTSVTEEAHVVPGPVQRTPDFFADQDVSIFSQKEKEALQRGVQRCSKKVGITLKFLKALPLKRILSIEWNREEKLYLMPIGTLKKPRIENEDDLYAAYNPKERDEYFFCIPEIGANHSVKREEVNNKTANLEDPFWRLSQGDLNAFITYLFSVGSRVERLRNFFDYTPNKSFGVGLYGSCFALRKQETKPTRELDDEAEENHANDESSDGKSEQEVAGEANDGVSAGEGNGDVQAGEVDETFDEDDDGDQYEPSDHPSSSPPPPASDEEMEELRQERPGLK